MPLSAAASTAGNLFSANVFQVPPFQREYSWQENEVNDFWNDLQGSLEGDYYFIGLIVLTDKGSHKYVVDGQQRIITTSLLANALYHEALRRGRTALADRIQATFIYSIDFQTDEIRPRVLLSDKDDDATYKYIVKSGEVPRAKFEEGSVSQRLCASYTLLLKRLRQDLEQDPFKRLGQWADFLMNRLHLTLFIHPDESSAYQVYEVINTRGRELTTADLLKNYVLSATPENRREERYVEWKRISSNFPRDGSNNFVQYIRHVVTVRHGHILPKDLFAFLVGRKSAGANEPPTVDELMSALARYKDVYLQMVDPTLPGPADPAALRIFGALNALGVIAVRPILLALSDLGNPPSAVEFILRLVVRRIVVGTLGTGNVERRLGEAARRIDEEQSPRSLARELSDLNPVREDFVEQLRRRSPNKNTMTFMRRSILYETTTPEEKGTLHYICPRETGEWNGLTEEERAYWAGTLGNTFLSENRRRANGTLNWPGFKSNMLPTAVPEEISGELGIFDTWNAAAIEEVGSRLAKRAGQIWYEERK